MLNTIYKCCCGADIHKKTVVACLLKTDDKDNTTEVVKTFSTMTYDLINLRDWLIKEGCTHIAIESTGVYWIPIFNVLEGSMEVILANARHIKNVPGRKTDTNDAKWIASLLAVGLVNGSFIPPKDTRELRELTRYRDKLIGIRSSEKNRIQKLLQTCNIKLSSVVSDVFGKSGTDIISALISDQEDADANRLAHLAKGTLRNKIPELTKSLQGTVSAHTASILQISLNHLTFIDESIEILEKQIQEKVKPNQEIIDLIQTVPGIKNISAHSIIAEIGIDMSQFHSAEHLVSWAGLSPGSNESAGKKKLHEHEPGTTTSKVSYVNVL